MYCITKETIVAGVSINVQHFAYVHADLPTVKLTVVPKLNKLATAMNLNYKRIHSNTRVRYIISPAETVSVQRLAGMVNKGIEDAIADYNINIRKHNTIIKAGNKGNRLLTEDVLKEADVNDYFAIHNTEYAESLQIGVLIVEG